MNQKIELKEKVLSNDSALTMKLTEMEMKLKKEITSLQEHIHNLENEEITFAFHPQNFNDFIKYPKNTDSFDFTKFNGHIMSGDYMDFNKLTSLKKIKMFDKNFEYRSIKEIPISLLLNDMQGYSKCTINGFYQYMKNPCYWYSIINLFDISLIHLPSVEHLDIHCSSSRIPDPNNNLRSLPNLRFIAFINYQDNILDTFELIKNLRIKHLRYVNCLKIKQLEQIKNWCDTKNIKLEIK